MAGAECDGDMRAVIDFAEWLAKNGQALYVYMYVCMYIYMVRRLAFPAPPPPPPMVWSGTGCGGGGGGGWRVLRGVGAVGAAAGETARRHRQGRHSTQAINPIT